MTNVLIALAVSAALFFAIRALVNQLTIRLRAAEAARQSLEQRVAARTAELEAALEENRTLGRQLRLILRTIPDQLWLKDREGRYLLVSDALAAAYGHTPEAMIGRRAADLFEPSLSALIESFDRELSDHGRSFVGEWSFTDPAGATHWYDGSRTPIFDAQGAIVGQLGVARTINRRKAAAHAVGQQLRYAEALAQCSRTLLVGAQLADQGQATLEQALEIIRVALATDQVALIGHAPGDGQAHGGHGPLGLVAAAHRPGLPPQRTPGFEAALAQLAAGGEPASALFQPIEAMGRRWGYLALDDQAHAGGRDERARQFLRTAGEMIVSFIDRQEAARALQERERLLREMGHIAQVGGWELDLASDRLFWSEEVYAIHEIEPGVQLNRHDALAFYAPEGRPTFEAAANTCIADGTPWDLELPFITAKGRRLWVRAQGQAVREGGRITRLRGTFQDITKRKESELSLRTSEARYRTLVGMLPDTVVLIFDRQLRFTLAAGPALGEVGLDPATFEGQTLGQAWRTEQTERLLGLYRDVLAGRSHAYEWACAGRIYDVQMLPMYAPDGAVSGGLFFARDVTLARQAEQALREAKEAAEAADRAKSAFLAMMSHEIRTPLNAVIGMTSLLLESELSAEQREYAATVRTSGTALLALINDILDLSRIEAGQVILEEQTFSPADLLREALSLLSHQADAKGLALRDQISPALPRLLSGDATRLRQIVANLLSNAVKFTQVGEVVLEATSCQEEGGLHRLALTVRDTGIGITADELERIFRPFVQADSSTTRRYGGSGLGLAISRQLAELMGGTLTATSQVGLGSSFMLTLVLRQAEGAARPEPPLPADERPPDALGPDAYVALRLLLAEDNPINQLVTLRLLERLGCQVDLASNGREAVEAIAYNAYDVVLMDVQMPDLDGEQATGQIRAFGDAVYQPQIVALTAHALTGDRERALAIGMDAYLSKPVQLDDLRAALAAALRRRPDRGAARYVPLIDWVQLEQLLALLGTTDAEQVVALRRLVHDELGAQIARLGQAVDAGDRAEIARLASALRGASRQLGATTLARCCDALEQGAATGEPHALERLYSQVSVAFAQVLRLLLVRTAQAGPA